MRRFADRATAAGRGPLAEGVREVLVFLGSVAQLGALGVINEL